MSTIPPSSGTVRLVGAVGPDGERIDVECSGGRITACYRGGLSAEARATAGRPEQEVDLSGMTLLPALAEPHAHIDKAYTADRYPNPTGDLDGAIEASHRSFAEMTVEDIARNARRSLAAYLAKGCLSVRTHAALGPVTGLRSVEGILEAVEEFKDLLDVQVVAHISPPIHGVGSRENLALLRGAIAVGATHVGGTPYRAEDPVGETLACLEEAAAAELPVDLHTDETLDPSSLTVLALAAAIEGTGFPFAVAASHCVSLGVQPPDVQRRAAEAIAAAGIAVISLPQTNLFLQGRGHPSAKPRGLTALPALYAAGVAVAAGGDNVQDPFNPMGRGDPLEAASLLVTAGHLDASIAFGAVTSGARSVMGLEPAGLTVGSPADLVAVPGAGLREAIAEADSRRVVLRRGVVVDTASVTSRALSEREAASV